MYARVAVDTGATSSIDSLTYEVPDGLAGEIGTGSCVLVPLASRQAVGYVIVLEEQPAVENTRSIIGVLDSPVRLSEEMLRLAEWISVQYLCPVARVVMGMLPGVMHMRVQARVACEPISQDLNLSSLETKVLEAIAAQGPEPAVESLATLMERSSLLRVLRQLEKKGAIRRIWQLAPPAGRPRVLKGIRVADEVDITDELLLSLPAKQAEVMRTMKQVARDAALVELVQRYGQSSSAVSALIKKGLLQQVDIAFRRDPAFVRLQQERVRLSTEQQQAVDAICEGINSGSYKGFLLHGVTASGKTEVYLRCIERTLELGKTSLVLLPEIALTTQVMNIFKSRFGDDVAVLHSALSAGERCDEWVRIESGEAKVVLGARSAVFAPLKNIGLVVVDEEHESSYKQDIHPRYNARDVAAWKARRAGAALVLGSATPCVETYYRACQGEYELLEMASRIENRPMPRVMVADLREEYASGRVTIFSRALEDGIRARLERKEQVILLQNRRAYSTFLLCRDCGFVLRCPNCAVSLKLHSAEKRVSCHHCGHSEPAPTLCPSCSGQNIKRFGIGTERVEEETKKTFPEARVIRMDRDTTSRKGAHAAILNAFRKHEADILVGTQMIAKGLDFPNVTLVGVISADTSLNLPDFRAAERTFQLVSQVAGRSGRGVEPGEVVIQTFDPEQYAIKSAVNHDFRGFFEQELAQRQEVNYPPFTSLVNIVARDADEQVAADRLRMLVKQIKSGPMSERMGIEVIGPMPAVLSRLRGEYRWHLVLRSARRDAMLELVKKTLDRQPSMRKYLSVDVDPVSML